MKDSLFRQLKSLQLSRAELKLIMGGYDSEDGICSVESCPGGQPGFEYNCGYQVSCSATNGCVYCGVSTEPAQCCPPPT